MASLGYVNLGLGRTAKFITANTMRTCAILDNDQVKCWGQNFQGVLGYDDTSNCGNRTSSMDSLSEINLGVGRSAKKIFLGNYHTCVVLDNNQTKCWGWNQYAQLGVDDTSNRGDTVGSMSSLVSINLGSGRAVQDMALGFRHSCELLDTGKVKCWGAWNVYGQSGYDDTASRGHAAGSMNSLAEVDLGSGCTATQISTTYSHTCALLDNRQVKCWGLNDLGQLGYNDTANRGATSGDMATLGYVNLGY